MTTLDSSTYLTAEGTIMMKKMPGTHEAILALAKAWPGYQIELWFGTERISVTTAADRDRIIKIMVPRQPFPKMHRAWCGNSDKPVEGCACQDADKS